MAEENVYGVKPRVKNEEKQEVKTERYGEMFILVTKDKETQIAVANNIVSRLKFKTVKAAKEYIDSKPWDLIVNTTCACYDLYNRQNNLKK